MKTQLVVQLPISESTDFDDLIEIEDGLSDVLKSHRGVVVDGHDIGHGRFNVFVISDVPCEQFVGGIRAYLEFRELLDNAVIAARPINGGRYNVVWPLDHDAAFEV